uniref:Yippee-like 3 n=1 Tax=Rattus norvegicus TaxID=10116 RepID=A0ABK0LC16_RAT
RAPSFACGTPIGHDGRRDRRPAPSPSRRSRGSSWSRCKQVEAAANRAGGDGAHQERPPLPGQATPRTGPSTRPGEVRPGPTSLRVARAPAPQARTAPSPAHAPIPRSQALGSLCSPWAAPRVGPLPLAPAMVRISKPKTFQAYLDDCHRRYSCAHCRAHLANHDDLISKSFQGSQGRAYLFNSVVNVGCGPAEERVLLTGLHAVADIHCENCKTTLGWKYEQAFESSQKYKEGKYIIELNHMIKDNGWD